MTTLDLSKLFLEAVRALPAEYVRDGISLIHMPEDRFYCAHPDMIPLVFSDGVWHELKPINRPGATPVKWPDTKCDRLGCDEHTKA